MVACFGGRMMNSSGYGKLASSCLGPLSTQIFGCAVFLAQELWRKTALSVSHRKSGHHALILIRGLAAGGIEDTLILVQFAAQHNTGNGDVVFLHQTTTTQIMGETTMNKKPIILRDKW